MRRDVDKTASLRTVLSIYALYGIISAQRRQSGNVSAHRVHIRGCSFGRPSPPDPSLTLRMTGKTSCTRSFADAQDDRKPKLRMTGSRNQDDSVTVYWHS